MRAVTLHAPLDAQIEEVGVPAIGPFEVLVKIRASGICGSDVNCYVGKAYEATFPYIPGHEWSGDVEEIGSGVSTLRAGDKVTGDTVEGCGICKKCKLGTNPNFCNNPTIYGFQTRSPGAFAQYVVRKESNLHKLPPGMTHEQGCLAEPLSVAYHAVWRIGGGVQAGDDVAIFGAGPIGLLVLSVVKASGARAISRDPIAFRRELARKLGADEVVDPFSVDPTQEVLRLTDGSGADVVFEATGSDDPRSRLLDVAETTGRIVMIGQTEMKKLPIELEKVVVKGLTIRDPREART